MELECRKAFGKGRSTVVWAVLGNEMLVECHIADVMAVVRRVGLVQGLVCRIEVDLCRSRCRFVTEGDHTCGSDHPRRVFEGHIQRCGHTGPIDHYMEAHCPQIVGVGQSSEPLVPCSLHRSGRAGGHNLCMACLPGSSWAA